ncbi:helix-turn-helix domain-containing protein [Streptomyces sp. B1866]|uniref:PucR family transcriptional regulator n=1 Tax=Streptomyces sp. B1866 TaxID=3075431 RepID=UPI00288FF5D0|nr:helix-turn-helix domain-containing protein [Streptomyces sp. B1866]MDT3397972.1 helix-turn-helix domain-containing protein [Streptomyces sp. B1866]
MTDNRGVVVAPRDAPAARASLVIGGQRLERRLAEVRPALVASIVELLLTELPVFRLMTREEITGSVTDVVDHIVRSFTRCVRDRTAPDSGELAMVRESVVRRAEEGMPADVLLSAYHLGTQEFWNALTADARPEDVDDVLEASRVLLRHLVQVQSEVCAGYLEGFQARTGGRHAEAQALMAALVEGRPVEQFAERAGLVPPPGYLSLYVSVPAHPEESAPGVDPLIAARRKLRRVRAELDQVSGGAALCQLAATGGLILLPRTSADAALTEDDLADARRIQEAASRSAGVPTTVAVAASDVAGVPAAAELAREVLEVVRLTQAAPGLYQLADVLVEYQLTRPSPAHTLLAQALLPLRDRPELLATLRTYLDAGLDRRAAAARLHLHPNTVDYRLRKIASLTGIDAGNPADLPRLTAALAAFTAAHPA